MEQLEKYSWLDEFLQALEKTLGFMDLSTLQPTSWRHFQPLIAQEWLDWFWRIIEKRNEQNIPFETVAQVLQPDLCREHLLFTLEDLKTAHWPLEKRLQVANFFYQTLKAQMPQGDLFGLYGTTRRHSQNDIRSLMQNSFEQGTPEIARELGKLYNGAYNLGASLYLDFYMGKAVENWGPYQLENNQILVIKEMRFLRPTEIWSDIKTTMNKIGLFAVYENVEFSTDLIACHTQYKGDVINGLKNWRMECDGKVITDISEIRAIGNNLAEVGIEQWQHLTTLPERELLQKAVWIRCYMFKEVCDLLGIDWQPTKQLLDAIKNKTLQEGWKQWKQPIEKEAFNEYWRKIWDPRIDFYP